MKRVLVINSGSSSLKWTLLDMDGEVELGRGLIERIGEESPAHRYDVGEGKVTEALPEAKNHQAALVALVALLERMSDDEGIRGLHCVGHRVVHGGPYFTQPVRVDDEVKRSIRECISLAPLHNPPNLMGIEACESEMAGVPQVAAFDTAFHQTMPERAYRYALPTGLADEHGLRRYGFHGISHQYVAQKAAEWLGPRDEATRIVTCHLGNGASIAAVLDGRCQDTSMGLTPLEGLVMGTRSGDVDPGLVLHLQRALSLSVDEVDTLLNRKSGMAGLSGLSNDLREIEEAAEAGNERAKLALECYAHRICKYVGAYAAILGGLDALVFTAGVGEKSPIIRKAVCRTLGWMGIHLDAERNGARSKDAVQPVSRDGSPVAVLVIPTNEELMIARQAVAALEG